jgi:hypothetical protein
VQAKVKCLQAEADLKQVSADNGNQLRELAELNALLGERVAASDEVLKRAKELLAEVRALMHEKEISGEDGAALIAVIVPIHYIVS